MNMSFELHGHRATIRRLMSDIILENRINGVLYISSLGKLYLNEIIGEKS